MDTNVLQDEWLNKAFQLAYFIHGDKAIATQIVTSAMTLLEVAATAQDKRLYYTPTGRSLARKARTKISVSELHLLQRLLYIESEPYEKNREESDAGLDEQDLLTHFIKHLVKITVKRNSFYVTLGVSRLLHNYTTAETQEIYNIVVQDPERVKDDYYYRSRKAQLMREMKERFGNLLQCVKGQRGEEKFQAMDADNLYSDLVAECLRRFTPWGTPCLMPARFDAFNDDLKHLSFKDADPDEEHLIEVNRIHTLLHFECYRRLATGIGYDSPELKLQIPKFSLVNQNKGGPKSGRKNTMTLHEEELERFRETLTSQSTRRKHLAAGLFRVLVDGKEVARFDAQETSNIHFEIGEGAELIEVRASDEKGELLLASHLLEFDCDPSGSKAFARSIVLEGGQRVSFSVQPFCNPAGEMDGAIVGVTYKETSPLRVASLFLQQLKRRAAQGLASQRWISGGAMKPILATLFVALCAAVVFFYFQSTRQAPEQIVDGREQIVKPDDIKDPDNIPQKPEDAPAPSPDLAVDKPTPEPQQQNREPQKQNAPEPPKKRPNKDIEIQVAEDPLRLDNARTNPNDTITDGGRRNSTPPIIGVPLVEVKRIGVAAYGAETLNPQIHEALVKALQATGRFDVVENGADAVLKISTKRESLVPPDNLASASIIVRLVNAKGYVVWPATGTGASYQGDANEIAAKIAANLLSEIQKAERRK